jgi:hypothetical protein
MADSDPVPDTAMETGSEDGDFGDTSDGLPLQDDERAILDQLRDAATDVPAEQPPPTFTAPADAPPDPLDPIFREPNA